MSQVEETLQRNGGKVPQQKPSLYERSIQGPNIGGPVTLGRETQYQASVQLNMLPI